MKFQDYCIETVELDAEALLSEWKWTIPPETRIFAITKFGDWFLVSDDDRLLFLDSLDGSLSDLGLLSEADLTSDLFVKTHRELFSADWIEICLERKLCLTPEQCFGWKLHPLLGGKFEFDNIKIFSIRVYETVTGQIVRQLKGKPQGYRVSGFSTESP